MQMLDNNYYQDVREIDLARFIVEKTNFNLFLSGKAGTGKTTFLREIDKFTQKKHVLLAPTGIAAVNAGAMTIHSFFQFGLGPYVRGVTGPGHSFAISEHKLDLIRNLEMIIIDEVSMVRADVMDHINDELQRIRRNFLPFGGVQMILIGDLQQLPPVAKEDEKQLFDKYYQSMYFFDSKALSRSRHYYLELRTVFRQRDPHFIEILNRARTGRLTETDLDELNAHYIPDFQPQDGQNYIRLVTHNSQADQINEAEMASLDQPEFNFEAAVSKDFPQEMFPTSQTLKIKPGSQVIFIRNDPNREFVNGTIGMVEDVDEDVILVRLADTDKLVLVSPLEWENVRYEYNEASKSVEKRVKGKFVQYPLKPAWAITVHKSQGLSFDRAVIDVGKAFLHGQAYVALSRCRSLDGLVLNCKLTASAFINDGKVNNYLDSIRLDIKDIARDVCYEPFEYDKTPTSEKPSPRNDDVEIVDKDLYETIRAWRRGRSEEIGLPPFCVFSNRTMAAISNARPSTEEELLAVNGMGPVKYQQFGAELLNLIREYHSHSTMDGDSGM